jgi:hypothetical protein
MFSMSFILLKKKKKSVERYMNYDDIGIEIVVLSGDWRFSLSSFIK